MSRRLTIPEALRERQARASDPKSSAFVAANAGSGKTHVLTQRVLRLLLKPTPPAQILCLAYTKAAAANMAERIFSELARWTSLDDEALTQAIMDCGAEKPAPHDLVFARQLFARTIETPGGLKIQTIHAFAERLLRLFPFEANVPARFKVIDAIESKALLAEARDAAISALNGTEASAQALDRVAREAGALGFDDILQEALSRAEAFSGNADAEAFVAALSSLLQLDPGATAASVEAEMLGGDIGRARRERWASGLERGLPSDRQFAEKLREASRDVARGAAVAALCDAFFTGKNNKPGEGDPRGGLATKALRKALPALDDELRCEQERLIPLRERLRAARTLERSAALFTVAAAILSTYAQMKAERGALDFDDQIARALALLTRSSAAWVLQKLDYGLDHLLLDEAQDASARQWGILEALSDEFFAGAGARKSTRTIFAVGDEKQSIFAFQGAVPEMFAAMKRVFAKRHRDADLPFADVPLTFSLRSSQTILNAVDRTFGSEAARLGLAVNGEPPPAHEAIRRELKGVVELWPPLAPEPTPAAADWRLPLDHVSPDAPSAILARRIAEVIRGWVRPASRERVIDRATGEARPIRESDVMILVRSRNALFETMVKALKVAGLKAAGADRLKLTDHIAVMDLIAAGRAALLPDDDLTLAAALKSPLIGLNDDQLMAVAVERNGSLVKALEGSDQGFARDARARLAAWRGRAKALSPFAFYALLLGEDSGRRALIGRLGLEAADPIDEFLSLALAHERREAPSLPNFLAEVESTDAEIKRDMEVDTEGVRVLTVHASKGLEAPIVFLPDACGAPYYSQHDPKLLRLSLSNSDDPPLYAWARSATLDPKPVADARASARANATGEHRRLLYVAMTRAAERLIVAGCDPLPGRPPECWYNLVHAGLKDLLAEAPAPYGVGKILRYGEALWAESGAETPQIRPASAAPDWLLVSAAPETAASPLSPSRLGAAGTGNSERIREGRLVHALLELLPGLAPEQRASAAKTYLKLNAASLAEEARAALASKVLAAVGAPELAPLFGPESRGEVPLTGLLPRPGRPDLPYSGRVDRLLVTADSVSIADFKLGPKPDRPAAAHLAQLALYRAALQPLYPGLPVRATLVYLDGPTTAPVGDSELDAAIEALAGAP